MFIREETGTVSQVYSKFEWAVKDMFSYTETDVKLHSPPFSICSSRWFLRMCPSGETRNWSEGFVSLFLFKGDDDPNNVEITYNMGLKKVDGTVENIIKNSTRIFKYGPGFGLSRFLKRSILLERKEELAPSGTFTVTCTIGHCEEVRPISRSLRLSDDLESMFIDQRGCDTILKVQNEEFHVNKSILMSRSPVLKAMFEVEMAEKNTGVVHIKDCTPETFKDFLRYIYSGKFTSSSNHAFQLYSIAHKYDVEELMSDCIACITTNLSIDNVLDAAVIGYTFDDYELQSKTQHLFNKNYAEIMLSSKWSSFLRENVSVCEELMKNMANKVVKNKSRKRKLDDL